MASVIISDTRPFSLSAVESAPVAGSEDAPPNWDHWYGYAWSIHDRTASLIWPGLAAHPPGRMGFGGTEDHERKVVEVAVEAIQYKVWDHEPHRQEIEEAPAEAGFPPPLPPIPESAYNEDRTIRMDVWTRFRELVQQFRRTGWWPSADEQEEFVSGRGEMPTPPAAED